ncbi:hypothetical protein AB0B94_31120 [Micromonospora sp. NPDC048986]|uniref:hypothetical protein n=1 Tax=Micromonospora sp. NPDC048986 TaxID=3155644 RepID=UPI0033F3395E
MDAPECCEWRGLFYPDGQKRCFQHASAADRRLVAETTARAEEAGVLDKQGDWPYGPNIDVRSRLALLEWAEYYELRRANTYCRGLHWLLKGRCGVQVCNQRLGSWMDHVTRWTYKGKPAVMIAQPYGVRSGDFASLAEVEAEDTLNMWIKGGGWYGWGTVAVEVWRKDAHDEWHAEAYAKRQAEKQAAAKQG